MNIVNEFLLLGVEHFGISIAYYIWNLRPSYGECTKYMKSFVLQLLWRASIWT